MEHMSLKNSHQIEVESFKDLIESVINLIN